MTLRICQHKCAQLEESQPFGRRTRARPSQSIGARAGGTADNQSGSAPEGIPRHYAKSSNRAREQLATPVYSSVEREAEGGKLVQPLGSRLTSPHLASSRLGSALHGAAAASFPLAHSPRATFRLSTALDSRPCVQGRRDAPWPSWRVANNDAPGVPRGKEGLCRARTSHTSRFLSSPRACQSFVFQILRACTIGQ